MTRLSSALIALTFSTCALDRRPCFVCAAMERALPSGVRGPVDLPPCILHLLRLVTMGFWQRVPWRVFAKHLVPCQFGPISAEGFLVLVVAYPTTVEIYSYHVYSNTLTLLQHKYDGLITS